MIIDPIWEILEFKGINQSWLAEKLGISESEMTKKKKGRRGWTEAQKDRASEVLMLPRSVLFLADRETAVVYYETTVV
jgi:hypothetical protein